MNLDFLNSIDNSLKNLDLSIHDKIKNTFIDDFIHELRYQLFKTEAIDKLKELPKDTKFYINDIEKDYFDCRELNTRKEI